LILPSTLVPLREGSDTTTVATPFGLQRVPRAPNAPLVAKIGTPLQIVQNCRTSIVMAALPYGVVRVDAASAGRLNRTRDGRILAPIEVRVIYARANTSQTRQSRVACELDADGAVVALR
jgi:hypothetical protein